MNYPSRANGTPIIPEDIRRRNMADPAALKDLISSLYLYIGRRAETQLTTEQKELLYDVTDEHYSDQGIPTEQRERWWHE